MDSNLENPFTTADRALKGMNADLVLVDFHAEATSEKGAMGYYLDGRAQALWGTHTHVPTADVQVLPKGLGFVTDLGMTGPAESLRAAYWGFAPNRLSIAFWGDFLSALNPLPVPASWRA